MDNPAGDAVGARIDPRHVIVESTRILWHLRTVLLILFVLFVLQSTAMYYLGGPVDTVTHAPATPARVAYFCAITALTIGYGDVVPTTDLGRILAVSLGMLGVLISGLVTAAAVYGVQAAAHRAGILPR